MENFALIQKQKEQKEALALAKENDVTAHFGLALSEEEAKQLMVRRDESLKRYRRVEFGEGILKKLVDVFCDSPYVTADGYLDTLTELQDMFYEYKNETRDKVTDDELFSFMREQLDNVCFGDLDYLENTCLMRLAAAIRTGMEVEKIVAPGGYKLIDEESRWSQELFEKALADQFEGR